MQVSSEQWITQAACFITKCIDRRDVIQRDEYVINQIIPDIKAIQSLIISEIVTTDKSALPDRVKDLLEYYTERLLQEKSNQIKKIKCVSRSHGKEIENRWTFKLIRTQTK